MSQFIRHAQRMLVSVHCMLADHPRSSASYPEWQGSIVAAMCPQAMRYRRDSDKATHDKRCIHKP